MRDKPLVLTKEMLNMNLLSKATTFVGAMTLAVSSFASVKAIDTCPSIESIQAQGISMVLPIDFDMYIGMETSQYDTDHDWAFLIGPVESDDFDAAVGLANDALQSVSGVPVPEEDEGIAFCQYNTGNEDLIAIAASADDIFSTQKIKHLFHKK